jgi:glycosyltransferase involved in cell wall biosynthesis
LNQAIRYQGEYDGYVYLTKEMSEVIDPQKPYIVVEGVADVRRAKKADVKEKSVPTAIMYAGMLHKKYGILNLAEAFCRLNKDSVELWLFGDGSCVKEIKEYCKLNGNIKYFGNTDREKVLEYERKATLLVNVRDPADSFTKYSFPSKTIEYMLSGTPMLTTKLPGIPEEYFDYLFHISDVSVESIAAKLSEILELSENDLCEFGNRAQEFIIQNKKASDVGKKIIDFIEKTI